MKSSSKLPIWLLVIPLLLISTLLISSQLGNDSLDDDEKNSVKHLVNFGERFTLLETINSVKRTSPEHVPGFHLQLSIWANFVGLHFVSLRTMLLFYFVLSVAMAYRLARDLFTPQHGIFAVFVVAFSGFHIHYAHEIRMYALVVFQTLVILWVYWRIIVSDKPNRWYHFVVLFTFSVYGMYTHNLILFPLLSIGLYHILLAPKTIHWFYVTGLEVLAGIAFLPWVPNLLNGASGFEDLSTTHQTVPEILFNSAFVYSNGFWIALVFFIGLIIWKFPKKNRNFRYIVITLVVMIIAMLVFNEMFSYIPSRRMRYTLIWFPSLAVLCSLGLGIIFRYARWLAMIILLGWLGMLVWFLPSDELYHFNNLERANFRQSMPFHVVGETIKNQYDAILGQHDPIVFFDSEFEYQSNLLNYYETIYKHRIEFLTLPITDNAVERIDKINNSFPGFWFSYRPLDETHLLSWQSDDRIQDLFNNYHKCISALDTERVRLTYYLDDRLPCDLLDVSDEHAVVFNNGYSIRKSSVTYSGSLLDVSILWDEENQMFDSSFGFSLQVFRDGEKVGQTDYPVDNIATHNVIELADTLPGKYFLHIILYSSEDVKSIGGKTSEGVEFERDTGLASFDIANK